MAKILEEIVVIKVSKLAKDSDTSTDGILSKDASSSLEQIVQELVGTDAIVEIIRE